MNWYYLVFVAMCILCLIVANFESEKKIRNCFFVAAGLLIVLSAVRDVNVGADTKAYCDAFAELGAIKDISWIRYHGWEVGYIALNKLLIFLNVNERVLLLVTSILIMIPVFLWVYRDSPMPVLSLLAFVAFHYWMDAMGVLRQWCAIAICILSFGYIKKRKFVLFCAMIIAAMFFHRTAIVFFPLYFLYQLKIDGRLLLAGAVAALLLGVLGKPIMNFVNKFARIPVSMGFNGGVTMLIVLWILVLLTYWLEKNHLSEPEMKLPYLMIFLAAVLQPVVFTFSLWSRIVRYYAVAMIIVIPNLYHCACIRQKENKILLLAKKISPGLHGKLEPVWSSKSFKFITHLLVFAVLYLWFYITDYGLRYTFMS